MWCCNYCKALLSKYVPLTVMDNWLMPPLNLHLYYILRVNVTTVNSQILGDLDCWLAISQATVFLSELVLDMLISSSSSFLEGFPWLTHFDLVFAAPPKLFLSLLSIRLSLRRYSQCLCAQFVTWCHNLIICCCSLERNLEHLVWWKDLPTHGNALLVSTYTNEIA